MRRELYCTKSAPQKEGKSWIQEALVSAGSNLIDKKCLQKQWLWKEEKGVQGGKGRSTFYNMALVLRDFKQHWAFQMLIRTKEISWNTSSALRKQLVDPTFIKGKSPQGKAMGDVNPVVQQYVLKLWRATKKIIRKYSPETVNLLWERKYLWVQIP